MTGYIVMIHYHYDSTEPPEPGRPMPIYLDADEAWEIASSLDGSGYSGEVFEVEVPEPLPLGGIF